jgi:Rod binding domain-containing protein
MTNPINPTAAVGLPSPTAPTGGARAAESDLHRVATEFEAMLLRQLLHTAKMGGAAGSYGDMAVDALATGISQAGGIGLTRQLEAVLAGQIAHTGTAPVISRSSSDGGGRSGAGPDTP